MLKGKANKSVIIRITMQEKIMVSVLFMILGEVTKLTPLIIFKGKKSGRISKELNKNTQVNIGNIFSIVKENGWPTY